MADDVRIVPFRREHGEAVARLHRMALPKGFLSSLGTPLLAELYIGLADAHDTWVWVAESTERECVGFIAGTIDVRASYKHVLRYHLPRLALHALPALRHRDVWTRALETLRYPDRQDLDQSPTTHEIPQSNSRSELLSLAVAPEARGRGLGRRLIGQLELALRSRTPPDAPVCYRVVTDNLDARSNAFYRSVGFEFVKTFLHHDHPMSLYIKFLSPTVLHGHVRG